MSEESAVPTRKDHLINAAYEALLNRAEAWDEKDWDSATKFERHAVNAALDLKAAREEIAQLKAKSPVCPLCNTNWKVADQDGRVRPQGWCRHVWHAEPTEVPQPEAATCPQCESNDPKVRNPQCMPPGQRHVFHWLGQPEAAKPEPPCYDNCGEFGHKLHTPLCEAKRKSFHPAAAPASAPPMEPTKCACCGNACDASQSMLCDHCFVARMIKADHQCGTAPASLFHVMAPAPPALDKQKPIAESGNESAYLQCPQCDSRERRKLNDKCRAKPYQPIHLKQYHPWHDSVPPVAVQEGQTAVQVAHKWLTTEGLLAGVDPEYTTDRTVCSFDVQDTVGMLAEYAASQVSAALAKQDKKLQRATRSANCGGWSIGRKCASPDEPDHEIFGPFHGLPDGKYICDFHWFKAEVERLRSALAESIRLLDEVAMEAHSWQATHEYEVTDDERKRVEKALEFVETWRPALTVEATKESKNG